MTRNHTQQILSIAQEKGLLRAKDLQAQDSLHLPQPYGKTGANGWVVVYTDFPIRLSANIIAWLRLRSGYRMG